MSLLLKTNILSIIVVLTLFLSWSNPQQLHSDAMCNNTREVLCVADVLKMIAATAKTIEQTANEIEDHILKTIGILDTMDYFVNFEINSIHTQLPVPKYHARIFRLNNINKNYLVHLFLEAHDASSFYYNSIHDVLDIRYTFALTTDSWLNRIQSNLQYEIICQYRSILKVYSQVWTPHNEINQIEFSKVTYQNSVSLSHDVHTIINIRLLREWMQRIQSVINNLETKFL